MFVKKGGVTAKGYRVKKLEWYPIMALAMCGTGEDEGDQRWDGTESRGPIGERRKACRGCSTGRERLHLGLWRKRFKKEEKAGGGYTGKVGRERDQGLL